MNCKSAQELMPYARPGNAELGPAEAHTLQRHLASCAQCRAEVRSAQAIDERLGRALRAVPIPAGLQERLLARLSVERRVIYRRWLVAGLAAAATVLIAVSGCWYWWTTEHGEAVVLDDAPAYGAPEDPHSAAKIKEHYRQQGHVIELPRDLIDTWDMRLLVDKQFGQHEGKTVPLLVFRKGTRVAKVRILRQGHFDIEALPEQGPRWHVLGNPARDRFIALVEFQDGGKLEDFLHPAQVVA